MEFGPGEEGNDPFVSPWTIRDRLKGQDLPRRRGTARPRSFPAGQSASSAAVRAPGTRVEIVGSVKLVFPRGQTTPRSNIMQRSSFHTRLVHACTLLSAWPLLATAGCREPHDPEAPSGGRQYELAFAAFVDSIAPILHARGCAAAGDCHGGGIRGTFELSPEDDVDLMADYEQTSLQVSGHLPDASPLLMKPLSMEAGGTPHAAKAFHDRRDPDFRTLERWAGSGTWR